MWIEPIYDRTQADVELIKLDPTNENNKGAYNYSDLNRVEGNCEYIKNILNNSNMFNKNIVMEIKTNWNVTDIPTIEDINRIRQNIITLISAIKGTTEYDKIEFSNTMDYIKANILERNLYLLKNSLELFDKEIHRCNTFCCGDYGIYAKEMS